jgi:hypothetical protein
MRHIKKWGVIFCAVTLLGGCAVGQEIGYDTDITVLAQGSDDITVAVQDSRPYVVSGDKEESFVGLQRGGFGNPFDVNTPSGAPLATEVARSLERGLSASGFDVEVVTLRPGSRDAKDKLGNGKAVLVTLQELKSDTYNNAAFLYDVTLEVFENGQSLASSSATGRDNLGGSFMNPTGHAREAVPEAWGNLLERLINDSDVMAAIER